MFFCSGDKAATYKFSDKSLEQELIFDKDFTETKDELYAKTEIPYTKVTTIY